MSPLEVCSLPLALMTTVKYWISSYYLSQGQCLPGQRVNLPRGDTGSDNNLVKGLSPYFIQSWKKLFTNTLIERAGNQIELHRAFPLLRDLNKTEWESFKHVWVFLWLHNRDDGLQSGYRIWGRCFWSLFLSNQGTAVIAVTYAPKPPAWSICFSNR